VPEGAPEEEVKRAFRRLALKYHPDRNPGRERESEERFKEINEAFSVLGNGERRREYDRFRRSPLAGVSTGTDFAYSQERIFRDSFADPRFFEDLSRMFGEAGLRFDQDFLNRVFGGGGFVFQFYSYPAGGGWTAFHGGRGSAGHTATHTGKPGLMERFAAWAGGLILRKLLGLPAPARRGRDIHLETVVSPEEAARGCEKPVSYRRGLTLKRLVVKIPPGTRDGIRLRLRGMGLRGAVPGDLYLKVRVKG
jgi:DnaJ-class molecular chaperone